jgi:DNA polymerase III alpha subunit (gram-positive type)
MIKTKRIIVYDFETNGFWSTNNQPIQVSCKIFDNGTETVYSSYIKCPTNLSSTIVSLTGITDFYLMLHGKDIQTVFNDLAEKVFIGDFIAVGHNILSFDNKFFNHYMALFGYDISLNENNSIDTMCHFRKILSNSAKGGFGLLGEWQKQYSCLTTVKNAKLSDMANYFDIPHSQLHNANKDVELNANVFFKLIDLIEKENVEIPIVETTVKNIVKKKEKTTVITTPTTSMSIFDEIYVKNKIDEAKMKNKNDRDKIKSLTSIMKTYRWNLMTKEEAIRQIEYYNK